MTRFLNGQKRGCFCAPRRQHEKNNHSFTTVQYHHQIAAMQGKNKVPMGDVAGAARTNWIVNRLRNKESSTATQQEVSNCSENDTGRVQLQDSALQTKPPGDSRMHTTLQVLEPSRDRIIDGDPSGSQEGRRSFQQQPGQQDDFGQDGSATENRETSLIEAFVVHANEPETPAATRCFRPRRLGIVCCSLLFLALAGLVGSFIGSSDLFGRNGNDGMDDLPSPEEEEDVPAGAITNNSSDSSKIPQDEPPANNFYYCGKSWTDAAATCTQACPGGTNEECPDGEFCFDKVSACSFVPGRSIVPDSTKEAVQGPDSSQSKAMLWMEQDPLLLSYNDWRWLQRLALATFFCATGDSSWKASTGWLTYSQLHECEWYSKSDITTCVEGHCISLSFKSNGLRGTIPREIGLLSNLIVLNLQDNVLSSGVPSEIAQLPRLSVLDLSENRLTDGSFLQQNSRPPSLHTFNLSGNLFSFGNSTSSLFPSFDVGQKRAFGIGALAWLAFWVPVRLDYKV